jgi:hypothetical protein
MHTKFWSRNLKGRGHSEDVGVDGKIREWNLGKQDVKGRCGLNASGSGEGSVAGSCEHGNKHSGSIKGR